MVEKEAEIIVLLLPLCYTVREIRAASAMTRLEARFSKKRRRKETKKTIRAANGILKPRKIRACKTRISEHEPRKGTETKYAGTVRLDATEFQNTNPERGRKLCRAGNRRNCRLISEHEPRKGTETKSTIVKVFQYSAISEHEPRKGTETQELAMASRDRRGISEHEPRKGTETVNIAVQVLEG